MNHVLQFAFLASVAALSGACASEEDAGGDISWKGAESHLVVRGHLNGEDLNLALTGDAADASSVWCGRKYVGPPDANGEPDISKSWLYKMNVYALVEVAGEARQLELEFKPHNFQADAVPTTVAVIPRVDGEDVPSNAMWTDFEWHSPDGEDDLLETSAQTGSFELELYTGSPGADGLMIPEGEGSFGGTLRAKWSEQEHLEVSMSALCTENELDLE